MSALTGLVIAPETGVNPPDAALPIAQMTVTSTMLPMLIEFNGRRYVLLETKNGGLLLNGAVIGGHRGKR